VTSQSEHRCRSRQIFGVAKDFAQISTNLPEKYPKESDLQKINKNKKTTACLFMLGVFFQIKALQAPFLPKYPPKLAQISPTLTENN